jgi:hypothetical protein
MAKNYITLDSRVDTFKDRFNDLTNLVGDLATLTTTGDSDLVQAINEHSAELGTITAGAMGTTASTVSTAIAELDAEADSDRTNFGANVKNLMLMDGTSKHVTVTANNSTNETTFITFVDGSADSQGIETDTGLTYNPSSGLITAVSLAAATLDISGNVDIDGTLEVGAISGTSADFDAGVTIDNLTIDGTSVASSSTLSLDAAGDITIDAGGAEINLKDDGTTVGHISMASSNLEIKSSVSDKDMIFKGNDGGSEITALTLDMANAGAATFNNKIIATELDISGNVDIDGTTNLDVVDIDGAVDMATTLTVAGNVDFNGDLDVDGTTNLDVVDIDGAVNMATTLLVTGNVDFNGNLDVDGTTNLDAVDIDGAVDMATTLNVAGVLSAASLDISGDVDIDGSLETDGLSINGTTVSSTATELNLLDGVSGLVQADFTKLAAVEATATELNLLDGVSGLVQADFTKLAAVTSSAAEINLLDGVSGLVQADFTKLAAVDATATELNIIDGGTSATSTTIADADRVIVNDGGTMKQVAVTDLAAYFDDEITAMPNLVTTAATTVGVLNSGSITSGFGSINVGSSSITTTGAISGGSVTVGGAALNETELEILDGALITTTELNVLNGSDPGNASNASITVADADALIMNDGGTMRQVDVSLLKSYFGFEVVGGTSITSLDIDGGADIGAAIVDADLFIVNDGASGDAQRKATASRLLTYTNAGTLSQAAQTNITSLGTLTALQVDQLNLNAGELKSTSGNLSITPASGSTIILDGQINIDAGVVTGASSITSTAFVGNVTGASASTASGDYTVDAHGDIKLDAAGGDIKFLIAGDEAASVKVAAVSSSARTTIFTAGELAEAVNNKLILRGSGTYDGGTSVDYLTFDPSAATAKFGTVASGVGTGNVFATTFTGALAGNATTATAATALATGRTIGMTGDVVWTSASFTGAANVTGSATIQSSAVETAMIATGAVVAAKIGADAVTAAKIGDDVINSEHYAAGSIDREHLAADIIDGTKIADDVINSEHYVAGSIDREHLAADIIDGTKIANDVINSEHYAAASIDREHLAADIIDGTKIANDVINSEHYAAGSIDNEHMSANSINSDQYVDGSIDTAHIADDQVTYAKMQDLTEANVVLGGTSTGTVAQIRISREHVNTGAIIKTKLASLRTFTLKDSAGTALFTMFGCGE